MTLLEKLTFHTQHTPDKIALEFLDPPRQTLTYAELDQEIARAATRLDQPGLRAGDRLALQLPKTLDFILLHLAAMRMGAVTLPLNPAYPPDELAYFLRDSEASLFFADVATQERLQPVLETIPTLRQTIWLDSANLQISNLQVSNPTNQQTHQPTNPQISNLQSSLENSKFPIANSPFPINSPAVMIYTSGTTGRPKGAVLTHANLTAQTEALHTAWGWQTDDILLHVLPLFHVHGLFVALHGALYAGATTLLFRQFDARRTLQTLAERRCTVFMAVPTIHRRLLDVPDATQFDLAHMRLLTSGSDRLPDEVFTGFQQTFGHTLLERYGMTETGMNLSNPLHGERRMGSVGLPLPGVEARIAHPDTDEPLPDGEVGLVQIRGPHVFTEYWRQPEKTAEAFTPDGWLRTGDLGFRAPDGYFTLQGRAKDLIITGGLNVYPPEVERVLADHPAVAANAVIGCPDPEWGEKIVAVVVPRAGVEISENELIEYCQSKLARYKSPRRIVFAPDLPRNAMGKVQKMDLRKGVCV
ncbi:MAG: AMP-binding protein [Anaerolineales bacterium]|nr:AMP-binding protein [Anaerolineales bacterium]